MHFTSCFGCFSWNARVCLDDNQNTLILQLRFCWHFWQSITQQGLFYPHQMWENTHLKWENTGNIFKRSLWIYCYFPMYTQGLLGKKKMGYIDPHVFIPVVPFFFLVERLSHILIWLDHHRSPWKLLWGPFWAGHPIKVSIINHNCQILHKKVHCCLLHPP